MAMRCQDRTASATPCHDDYAPRPSPTPALRPPRHRGLLGRMAAWSALSYEAIAAYACAAVTTMDRARYAADPAVQRKRAENHQRRRRTDAPDSNARLLYT